MKELCARVVAEKADLGVGYDGDADRIGVVDEEGTPALRRPAPRPLRARHARRGTPGSRSIFDVKCSQGLEEDIRAHGGRPDHVEDRPLAHSRPR